MVDPSRRIPRREFVKSAVAIGGTAALSACLERGAEPTEADGPSFSGGPADLSMLPERQHVWGTDLVHGPHGNAVLPQHQLMLFVNNSGSGTPTEDERETIASDYHGILHFLEVASHTTFLRPPRSLSALPSARPGEAG